MPQVGDRAISFHLETDAGGPVSLESLKGRWIVLYFYPKDDTSGCTAEAIDFTAHAADFARAGARVIGVSPDSVASHGKFRKKHALDLTLAADTEKTAAMAYGVWVEKSMYGRKYMGVDRSTFLIDPRGRIAHVWRKVKVPGHVAEVLAVLKQLNA